MSIKLKYTNNELLVNPADIHIFPISERVYVFLEKVWSSFVNKMVSLTFPNNEAFFNHALFEVIQGNNTKIVSNATHFKLKEVATKKASREYKNILSKVVPTPIHYKNSISTKIIQRAIFEFNIGTKPTIEYITLNEREGHPLIKEILSDPISVQVALPLFVKDNPIGILWGLRKEGLTEDQFHLMDSQLKSFFDVIEFVVGLELDDRGDSYIARKNIEKADMDSISLNLFYTRVPNQKDSITSIIFQSSYYDCVYRLDASYIIPTSGGYSVSLKRFTPEKMNNSNVILLMIPGFFCRRSVLDRLAKEMSLKHGYMVFSMDMRGRSKVTLPKDSITDGWSVDDYIQDDFPAVLKWLRRNYPDKKVVVLGHSMGGMIPRFYTASYETIKKIKEDDTLPVPADHIAGVISVTSPNYIQLKSNIMGFNTIKETTNKLPQNFISDMLFDIASFSVHKTIATIDLNKFFKFLLNLHSSLRQFSFTFGTKVVSLKDFIGYKEISPADWYLLVEDIFCEESTKVIMQFIRSQMSRERSFLSYDGRINYTDELNRFTLPIFTVMGTLDEIVPVSVIERDLWQIQSLNHRVTRYDQGHLGIVFHPDTVRSLCSEMNEWIIAL